jgi:class 3 adenylate cyclase
VEPGPSVESRPATVLFTDLVGSVKMYSRVSDPLAVALVQRLDARVRETIAPHNGRFIKSTGDGHLLVFDDAPGAVRAARDIHGRCGELARESGQDLAVRVAAHSGDVFFDPGDIHGNTVNLCARLLAIPGAGETAITGETLAALPPDDRKGFSPHGPEVFKGFTRFCLVHRLPNPDAAIDKTLQQLSLGEDSALQATANMPRHARYALALEHPQKSGTFTVEEGETLLLGRAPECGVSVPDRMFSGMHGAFAVVDGVLWAFDLQSANGMIYRGRRIKRRRPLELNGMLQLPTGTLQVKLPG